MIRIGFGQTRLTDLLNNINGSNNETTKTEETDLFSFQEVSFVSLNKTNEKKEQIGANQSNNNTNTKTKTETETKADTEAESETKVETEADVKTKTEVNKSNNNIFSNNSDKTILINNFFKTEESKETEKSNETTDTTIEDSEKPKDTAPAYTPTVEAIPTSQEDIEAIWTEITKAHGAIANFTPTLSYSASNFYAQLNYMIESDNPVVKQFAEMFKNTFDSLNLDQAGGAALMERITANMQEKVYGKGVGISIGLLMKEPLKDCLEKLDTDKDGSIFDELDMIIQEEASKVKNFTKEEIENATTMDIEKLLNPTGKESKNILPGAIVDNSIDASEILNNLPDMLLCDDASVRKFGNMLTNLFSKYSAFDEEEKEKLIGKLFDEIKYQSSMKAWENSQGKPLSERTYIGVKPKAIYYTNGSFINKDELQNFDLDSDGNMFDDIENIVNSENFKNRYESKSSDFWDLDTFWDNTTFQLAKSSEDLNNTKTSLTNAELLELSKNDDSGIYGSLRRNFSEIDKNNDNILSYEEIKKVVGSGFQNRSNKYNDNFMANMDAIDTQKDKEYQKLTIEEKLEKAIAEARKYCEERGLDDHLAILNNKKWKITADMPIDGAAGDCTKSKHRIRIGQALKNYSFNEAVSTLLHEVTHACYPEKKNTIQQENDCDQIKEDYLDSVGRGFYYENDEKSEIDYSNRNGEAYQGLRHDNYSSRNKIWAKIKDWYD